MVAILLNYALISSSKLIHFSKTTITSKMKQQIPLITPIMAPVRITRYMEFSYTNFQSPQGSSSRPGLTASMAVRAEEMSPPDFWYVVKQKQWKRPYLYFPGLIQSSRARSAGTGSDGQVAVESSALIESFQSLKMIMR